VSCRHSPISARRHLLASTDQCRHHAFATHLSKHRDEHNEPRRFLRLARTDSFARRHTRRDCALLRRTSAVENAGGPRRPGYATRSSGTASESGKRVEMRCSAYLPWACRELGGYTSRSLAREQNLISSEVP